MTKGDNSIMDVSLSAEKLSEQYFSWYKNNTDFKRVKKTSFKLICLSLTTLQTN